MSLKLAAFGHIVYHKGLLLRRDPVSRKEPDEPFQPQGHGCLPDDGRRKPRIERKPIQGRG